MAKVTISEHRRLPHDANGMPVPVFGQGVVVQAGLAAPSASSQASAAVGPDTYFVRVCSDVALHIATGSPSGAAPTATTSSDYYPAGMEIVRKVAPGDFVSYLAG